MLNIFLSSCYIRLPLGFLLNFNFECYSISMMINEENSGYFIQKTDSLTNNVKVIMIEDFRNDKEELVFDFENNHIMW